MSTYKVKALVVTGKGNNLYRSGATVSASNFPEGQAEAYVTSGHLVRIGDAEQPHPDTYLGYETITPPDGQEEDAAPEVDTETLSDADEEDAAESTQASKATKSDKKKGKR